MQIDKGKMKTYSNEVDALVESIKVISEIGNELAVPNRPLPECEGCQYRMVDLSRNRHECFYKFIEKSSSNCKVKGYENKKSTAALL
ncbi:MAG: hypothetical protein ACE5EN_03935 [Nitrospinota bacterium]